MSEPLRFDCTFDITKNIFNANFNEDSKLAHIIVYKPTFADFPIPGSLQLIYVEREHFQAYLWDSEHNSYRALAGFVTGVKGDAESDYRIGNVNITKANIGLDQVDNTSDIDKPISTAQQQVLDEISNALTTHIEDQGNPHNVTKAQVGLGNVDNTADIDKPVSTYQAIYIKEATDTYTHRQLEAVTVWSIEHNLDRYPSVTVIDSGGTAVMGDITYIDRNSLQITFNDAFSGKAYLN